MDSQPNSPEARDKKYHLHSYTNARRHQEIGPMIIEKGDGIYVEDTNGKRYIEAMAGLWSVGVGFSEPRLVEAAARQMAKLPFYHNFTHKAHSPLIDLAEKLVTMAPVPMSKAFFTNSGSEANDTAMKMVWYRSNALGQPQRKKLISRKRGYHGVTIASASLTGLPNNQISFDLPIANVLHTASPAPLARRAAGRDRGAVLDAPGRRARAADPRRRPRDGRRLLGRAGDGCGRRRRAAGRLLGKDPGRAAEVRHPARRRRGDLRLRPHRQHVRLPRPTP